ncbi:MAG: YfhO family protein [Ruminococcus sp.]|nr:YfhO family protein [Ruminococcus sp.]
MAMTKTKKKPAARFAEKPTEAIVKPPKNGLQKFLSDNLFIILAFLVPFVLMVTAFGLMQVSPFGDKQILVTDLWHQYYPFLVDFQEKLKNGESLFWSWTQGTGVNYFALMSYYLAGPMNFLSVFIPCEWLREFLMFSVSAKVALAGCFMAVFLRSVYKKNDFSLVAFGCGFSFCAFFMGYYWNTIWLDTVCITPLVALGIVKLLTENKFRLYTVMLAVSLLSNYYIGLFTCIFVLLIFIAYSIAKWDGFKSFFEKLFKTGVFSLLAIGITAFFLLPAFFALQNTNASGSSFPSSFAINIGKTNDLIGVLTAMKEIMSNFITFISPATKASEALPNIACSTASLVLGILFFTSKKITLKEKIVDLCLILFMLISCVIRQLDYIWHGFHFTNMIPYRFSYLVSFVLVVMAFRAFMLIDFSSHWDIIIAALGSTLFILISIGTQESHAILGTTIISLVICIVLFLYTKRIIPKQVLLIILSIVMIGESGATAYIGVKTTTVTSTYDYPRGGESTAQIIEKMDELEANTPEMWRAETTSTQTLNDGSLNKYNGLSMFNSMANVNMTKFFGNFGMKGWNSGNRYTYAESSPVTNTFMNLKYIISRDGNYYNTYNLEEVDMVGVEKLLRNKHYIPMGFMVNTGLLTWDINENEQQFNPFDQQSAFFRLATGVHEDIYTPLEVVSQGHTEYNLFPVNKTSYGNYTYSCTNTTVKPHLKWNYEAPSDGWYCFYANITNEDNITVMVNDTALTNTFNMDRSYIASIGYCAKGDKISVYSDLDEGASGTAKVYVNKFNDDIFEKGYERISKDVMETTYLSGSEMDGKITVSEDGLFYTSVPYEKGWKAYVDGKEVEITPVGNALLAFKLSKGEHTIKLQYYPNGFWPGLAVSLTCLTIFALIWVYTYVIKKKKVKTVTPATISEASDTTETDKK